MDLQDELRRWATVASGLADLARNRAEEAVDEMLQGGNGPPSVVRDVMERTKDDREELLRAVRTELHNQLVSLGAATSRDVERLERALGRLENRVALLEHDGSKKPVAKKSTVKKSRAGKSTAGKPAGKPGAKRSKKPTTAKKSTRKRPDARKRSTPKKVAGRKAATGGSRRS